MSNEVMSGSPTTGRALFSKHPWLLALTRPSTAVYHRLAENAPPATWVSLAAVFVSAIASNVIVSIADFLSLAAQQPSSIGRLLVAVLLSSILILAVWLLFVVCAHAISRLLRGRGTIGRLVHVFAIFSAPLLVVMAALSLMPYSAVLQVGVYLYWIALYVMAVRTVYVLSVAKALFAVAGAIVTGFAVYAGLTLLALYLSVTV